MVTLLRRLSSNVSMNCTVRTVITQSSEPGCDETAMLGVGVPFGRFMSQHQGAVYRWHQSLVLTKYLPIYKYLRIYKYLQISPCPQVQLRQRLHDGGHLHPLLRRPPLERDQARLSGCVYLDIYPNYLDIYPNFYRNIYANFYLSIYISI